MRIRYWSSDVCASDLISLLSVQLRHHNGPLNTIPFGEMGNITNHSRDWVRVKIKIRVPFDTDLNKMRKAVRSEEHTSELQSLMRISYAVFCLKKKKKHTTKHMMYITQSTMTKRHNNID